MTHTVASPASDIGSVYYDADGGLTERSARTSGIPGTPSNALANNNGGGSGAANEKREPNGAATDASATGKDNYAAMFSGLNSRPGAHDKSDSVATVTPTNNEAQGPVNTPTPVGANGEAAAGADNASKSPLAKRAETAESQMDPKALSKITKAEAKDAKKEMKVLNAEAKTQSKLLSSASADLSKQQKAQKSAASDETKALKAHSKAVKAEHKLHSRFLNAKAKHEKAAADVRAKEELLESSRQRSQKAREMLSTKLTQVDDIKKRKSVDDREREVKLNQLQGTIRQKKLH
ncbi:hypothetical protein SCHPADRAFT_1000619 [Schizopora paradoxa]|uniref:DNA binding protein Ncp1 n=1 Tax=Schizopora paradoxa TaxID=27342 RepID=A0A0H2RHG1_9AGAM|nr:hypothetical protein SCHPADRAFT_1000619 [Schizopora paradoxa]